MDLSITGHIWRWPVNFTGKIVTENNPSIVSDVTLPINNLTLAGNASANFTQTLYIIGIMVVVGIAIVGFALVAYGVTRIIKNYKLSSVQKDSENAHNQKLAYNKLLGLRYSLYFHYKLGESAVPKLLPESNFELEMARAKKDLWETIGLIEASFDKQEKIKASIKLIKDYEEGFTLKSPDYEKWFTLLEGLSNNIEESITLPTGQIGNNKDNASSQKK